MDYELFKQEFEKISGICLDLYKEKQMKRRIDTLIERKRLNGYEDFMIRLKSVPSELDEFKDYITINVTEFFRTPDQWEVFESDALPELVSRSDEKLKIWCCACASGEEPYSVAMSLLKVTDSSRFYIIATDIDDIVLEKAKSAIYDAKTIEKLPAEILERFFVKDGTHFTVTDEVKNCVEFKKFDLLKEEFPSECDLIVCRNVLIYFTEEAKEMIYTKLKNSLKEGGYLFTGNTEQIIYYKQYGLSKIRNFLYKN